MKKIFAIIVLMATIVNTLPLFAGEYLEDAAWLQLREIHAEYLGRQNDMTHGETEMWIAQDMNRWLKNRKNDYDRQISDLKKENETLKKQIQKHFGALNKNSTVADTINTATNIREQNQHLTKANNELENKFNRCKIERNIAYSVIAIILVLFIAFILIKKCQAKKLPKVIEEAIASHDN